jgi:hypothetical protein
MPWESENTRHKCKVFSAAKTAKCKIISAWGRKVFSAGQLTATLECSFAMKDCTKPTLSH